MQTLRLDNAITVTGASVDLDRSVDLGHKEVRGIEADRSCQQPERENHQRRVAEVQKCRNKLRDFQLKRKHTTTILRDRPTSMVKMQQIDMPMTLLD